MRRPLARITSLLAILIVFWLIWSRLHIVLWVQVPWWAFLLFVLLLFLLVDYLLAQVFRRQP